MQQWIQLGGKWVKPGGASRWGEEEGDKGLEEEKFRDIRKDSRVQSGSGGPDFQISEVGQLYTAQPRLWP